MQVNSVVCGAAVLFRALRSISLRRCAALSDAALARLMRSSCPQLEARFRRLPVPLTKQHPISSRPLVSRPNVKLL